MQQYKNLGRNSGIKAFSIGEDYIDVQYDDSSVYRYSYKSAGITKIEQMKRLALQGQGLNSYITRNARKDYER